MEVRPSSRSRFVVNSFRLLPPGRKSARRNPFAASSRERATSLTAAAYAPLRPKGASKIGNDPMASSPAAFFAAPSSKGEMRTENSAQIFWRCLLENFSFRHSYCDQHPADGRRSASAPQTGKRRNFRRRHHGRPHGKPMGAIFNAVENHRRGLCALHGEFTDPGHALKSGKKAIRNDGSY